MDTDGNKLIEYGFYNAVNSYDIIIHSTIQYLGSTVQHNLLRFRFTYGTKFNLNLTQFRYKRLYQIEEDNTDSENNSEYDYPYLP